MVKRINGKKVTYDDGSHYKLEGDNFYYVRVIGGEDYPLLNVGPGRHPDPRMIGPGLAKPFQGKRDILSDLIRKLNEED